MARNEWIDAEQRVDRARDLYEQGQLAEAAAELRTALVAQPDQAAWHFNLALTLEAMEDYTEAIASFHVAIDLVGEDVECLNCLAACLAHLGRYHEALDCYARIDAVDNDYEPSYCNRIATYTELGNHEQAEVMFYRARQITDACPMCSYNIGTSLYVRGLGDRAILCWQEVLQLQPDHPSVHGRLAEAYWRLGKRELACQHFQAQLGADPNDSELLLDYGDLLMDLRRYGSARRRYAQAARLSPTDADVYVALGELAMKSSDADEAERWFQTAVTFGENRPRARIRLAQLLLKRHDVAQAAKHLTLALKNCFDDPKLLEEAGQVLMDAQLTHQARRVLGRLAELCPNNAVVHHNLAVTCFRLRRLDEGVRHCRRALRIRPNYPLALRNLAIAHMRLGRLDRARCYVARALRLEPASGALQGLQRRLARRVPWWRQFWRRFGLRRRSDSK